MKESEEEGKIIDYIRVWKLDQKSRKGALPDQRFYMIGLLYYKYGWTEHQIMKLFNRPDRCFANYGKNKPYERISVNDAKFMVHCKVLIKKFPYNFPKPKHYNVARRNKRVTLTLNKHRETKLLEFKKKFPELFDYNQTLKKIIDTFL